MKITARNRKPPEQLEFTQPVASRQSVLANAPQCTTSLGYILFVAGERVSTFGSAALEFLFDDPNARRQRNLPTKAERGFRVYYKHGGEWFGTDRTYETLTQAMPFLQEGNRVLVEYRRKR